MEKIMNVDNPFDRKLECQRGAIPSNIRDTSVFVCDTLDIAWAIACSVFPDVEVTPDLALQIYDRILARMSEFESEDAE
jgi:hypothetical protein